jgi:hypothetical protein
VANDALTAFRTYDAVLANDALTAFWTYDAVWAVCTNDAVEANDAEVAVVAVAAFPLIEALINDLFSHLAAVVS